MIKKNVLTVAGIILSLIIAVGGWILTSHLINMKSYRLLSETTSFSVEIPRIESPVIQSQPYTPLQTHEVRVIVNDTLLEPLGVVQESTLMIPFHAVAEALGETPTTQPQFTTVRDAFDELDLDEIIWDSESQTIYIIKLD